MSHYGKDETLFQDFCSSVRTLHLTVRYLAFTVEGLAADVRATFPALEELQLTDRGFELLPYYTHTVSRTPEDCLEIFKQAFDSLAKKDHAYSAPKIVIVRGGKLVFKPSY